MKESTASPASGTSGFGHHIWNRGKHNKETFVMASELKRQRAVVLGRLTRIEVYIRDFDSKVGQTEEHIQERLDVIDRCWIDYDTVQTGIEAAEDCNGEEESEKRNTFEERCIDAKAALRSFLKRQQGRSRTAADINSGQPFMPLALQQVPVLQQPVAVRLPTLDMPSFSGDYMDWPPFHDAFQALIDSNAQLSNVQKLLYLKSTLKGEAACILDSLDITEANYRVAWELLVNRYQNHRVIKQKHLHALFNIKQVPEDSSKDLRRLLMECQRNVNVLKHLGEPTDQWSTILVYLVTSKLDPSSRRDWENQNQQAENQTYDELIKFINGRCHTLETLMADKVEAKRFVRSRPQLSHASTSIVGCKICQGSQYHPLWKCNKFISMNRTAKMNEVKRLKLCYNCFSSKHEVNKCGSNGCKHCGEKHNSLLHESRQQYEQQAPNPISTESDRHITNTSMVTQAGHVWQTSCDILATALVSVFDRDGSKLPCRVLLDSGSQPNFITQSFAQKLRLRKSDTSVTVQGVSGAEMRIGKQVTATIESRANGKQFPVSLLVMNKITNILPNEHVIYEELPINKNKLADPTFSRPGKIDVLLGAKLFFKLLLPEKAELDEMIMWNSELGWLVSGSCKQNVRSRVISNLVTSSDSDLFHQLEKFWRVEDVQFHEDRTVIDPAEKHYIQHVKRFQDGRYEVKLPLSQDVSSLGESKEQALRRFHALERKLQENKPLRELYIEFMREYESTGHMSLVADDVNTLVPEESVNYLPHHAVLKPTSTTTRLRTVFDASSKTSSGLSLNDIMMTGPNIQADQFSLLLGFRCWKYVVTADIAKMYRQIRVDQESSNLQRVFWREDPTHPLRTYQLNTVTYGTRAAPFLAIRTLHQLAADENDDFPEACLSIRTRFYVDDLLDGSNDKKSLLKRRNELLHVLQKGGFELRKWSSNNSDLLEGLAEHMIERGSLLDVNGGEIIKSLGLNWDTRKDQLTYFIQLKQFHVYSRRTILSAIASLYDPVGLIAPVIITAKILMQQLWLLNVGWDDELPEDIVQKWKTFYDNLKQLQGLWIDRWAFGCQNPVTVEIHGFSDASMLAYGACIYMKTIDELGNVTIQLLCAKSRVAPLKKVTLPRLELCAAVLLSDLLTKVITSVDLENHNCYLWTDSMITLQWITSPSTRWKEFVANRVEKIQNATGKYSWKYVSGKENPADIVSRGLPAAELINSALWWNGPTWIKNESLWPEQPLLRIKDVPEVRKTSVFSVTKQLFFEKYSSLTRLKGVLGYVLRFIHNSKPANKEVKLTGELSAAELSNSLKTAIRCVQWSCFPEEFSALQKGSNVKGASKLVSLNPFIDDYGLLRVGGRLSNADIPYNAQHPVILPAHNFLSKRIANHLHQKHCHIGPLALLNELRSQYWPIRAKNLVKMVVADCGVCTRFKGKTAQQIMGDLPASRVQPARPFIKTGVDFAGPTFIRSSLLRKAPIIKAYIAVFICMATKAIHLELVGDLSTNSFLAALRRFVGRRGMVAELYSDNATNFTGANSELSELKQMFDKMNHKICTKLAEEGIKWSFIPPRSPNFGGLWEAGVKSVKTLLKKVCGAMVFTYEELNTLLVQIESILNSRPLTEISSNIDDFTPLTPAHFLIGDRLTSILEPDLTALSMNRLTRWQTIQQLKQQFWSRWSSEYLHHLQQRTKWKASSMNLNIGKMVLLKEDNLPPEKWVLARIVGIHPGTDRRVRVVKVKTSTGEYTRSVSKICPLPDPGTDF